MLRTPNEALFRRMMSKESGILMNVHKVDVSTLKRPRNKDRAYFEDQHLRHG